MSLEGTEKVKMRGQTGSMLLSSHQDTAKKSVFQSKELVQESEELMYNPGYIKSFGYIGYAVVLLSDCDNNG